MPRKAREVEIDVQREVDIANQAFVETRRIMEDGRDEATRMLLYRLATLSEEELHKLQHHDLGFLEQEMAQLHVIFSTTSLKVSAATAAACGYTRAFNSEQEIDQAANQTRFGLMDHYLQDTDDD